MDSIVLEINISHSPFGSVTEEQEGSSGMPLMLSWKVWKKFVKIKDDGHSIVCYNEKRFLEQ